MGIIDIRKYLLWKHPCEFHGNSMECMLCRLSLVRKMSTHDLVREIRTRRCSGILCIYIYIYIHMYIIYIYIYTYTCLLYMYILSFYVKGGRRGVEENLEGKGAGSPGRLHSQGRSQDILSQKSSSMRGEMVPTSKFIVTQIHSPNVCLLLGGVLFRGGYDPFCRAMA